MIKICDLRDLQKHCDIPQSAVDFLLAANAETPNGRYEFGENCYINVIDCQTKCEKGLMEAHQNYSDVQILLSGEEKILYADWAGLRIEKPYDAKIDCTFFSFDEAEEVCYRAGEGILLPPCDAHLPGLATDLPMIVKKAVVKLRCRT